MLSNRILLKWCPAFQDLAGQWKIYNSFITTRFQVFNTLVQTSSAWWWVVTFFLIRELHFLPAKRLQIHHEFCPTFTSLTNLPDFTTEKKDILFNQHCVKPPYYFFWKKSNSRTSGVVKFPPQLPSDCQNAEVLPSFAPVIRRGRRCNRWFPGPFERREGGMICWDETWTHGLKFG